MSNEPANKKPMHSVLGPSTQEQECEILNSIPFKKVGESELTSIYKEALKTAQAEIESWKNNCPECGSDKIREPIDRHKQCEDCYQEFFDDINYSDVVFKNLRRLKNESRKTEPVLRLMQEMAEALEFAKDAYWSKCYEGKSNEPTPTLAEFTDMIDAVLKHYLEERG